MQREERIETRAYAVYWATDNNGVRHLFHDHLCAQLMEERWAREAKEREANKSVGDSVPQHAV